MKENIQLDEKIVVPVLIAIVHLLEIPAKAIAKLLVCRLGNHEFRPVPGNEHLQYCERCRVVDDVRTSGIDSMNKKQRRKIAGDIMEAVTGTKRKTIFEKIRERRERRK